MAINYINLPSLSPNAVHSFITNPCRQEAVSNSSLFSSSQTESGIWVVTLEDYSSTLNVVIPTWMKNVTTGKVDVEVEIMAIEDGASASVNVASFDAVNEIAGGTTVAGTAEYPTFITIPCSNDDSPSGAEVGFIIRINRDHDDTDDTATDDMGIGPTPISLSYTTT